MSNLLNPFIKFPACTCCLVGGWIEVGRTTLSCASAQIRVQCLPDKRYYMTLSSGAIPGGGIAWGWRYNNDGANNYAGRIQCNGGTDITNGTRDDWFTFNSSFNASSFQVGYHSNLSGKEKLGMSHSINAGSTGSSTAPNRNEATGKWVNTSSPINEILHDNNVSQDYPIGAELVVLGWDPADTHTNNFWEQLATCTLSGTDSNVQLSISTRKYLWIQAYMKPTATLVPWLRFNNVSTGTPYAYRKSDNGESPDPAPSTSQNQMVIGLSESTPQFVNIFVINSSADEKLVVVDSVGQNTSGAGNVPTRRETGAKHALTGSQIIEVDLVSSTSTFASGSEFKIWGHD